MAPKFGGIREHRMQPLPREFYNRDPLSVAQDLLGKLLLRRSAEGLAGGRIVEVEAYLSADDPACHAARGQTPRNTSMFGPPGHAYVYTIHAKWCFNVVTERPGVPSAILVRAIEPLFGLPRMQWRRQREKLLDLARGPARLCQALAIDKRLDGWDLTRGKQLWVADDGQETVPAAVLASSRIGISSGVELLLRYFYEGSLFVSGSRRGELLPPRTPDEMR